jgi:chorismate dehydratase
MVIGDRGILDPKEQFRWVWDLGEEWTRWTGLPFVFAMWVARPDAQPHVDLEELDRQLTAARDEGERALEHIAREESPSLGIPYDECLDYLRNNLMFHLGPRQRRGLETFYELAVRHRLAAPGFPPVFHRRPTPAH